MSQDPEVIRQDIEETRTRMGETVEAIAYKTDLPNRARDAVSERVDTIKDKVSETIATATNAVGFAAAAMPSSAERLRAMRPLASANPLALAVGAIAAGFFLGLSLPLTALERERLGRVGERLADQARSAAGGALEQGRDAVVRAAREIVFGTAQRQA